jgi:hypothetical protein
MLVLLACNKQQNKTELVKVGEVVLYAEDINPEDLAGIYETDSVKRLMLYAKKWSEDMYFLNLAKRNIADDDNINRMINEYRNNLYLYELEKLWIENFSDTIISDDEIESYYQAHKDNFLLRSNIVKIRYVKLDKSIKPSEITKVKTWIFNPGTKNDSLIRSFAEKNADNFFLDDRWLIFDDVIREIPISPNFNQQRFLQGNKQVHLEENNFIYLVNFLDFKIKDENSPLEIESENIRKYILLQKKSKWLDEKKQKVLNEALKNKEIKLWNN